MVYLGICDLCEAKHKLDPEAKHRGIYVGQTYRTLAEGEKEDRKKLRDFDTGNFMLKHWVLEHSDLSREEFTRLP